MEASVFAVILLVVLSISVLRRLSLRRERIAWERQPGHSPRSAIAVESFSEIDPHRLATRCRCGGRVSPVGEGSRVSDGITLRVVQTECVQCEESIALFFEVREVLN